MGQHGDLKGTTVSAAVMPADIAQAGQALVSAQAALEQPTESNLACYAEAEERYRVLGGYDVEVRAAKVLAGLGLDPRASLVHLSGGQMRRAMLARLLLSPADSYLLDEPTNHLDVKSVLWLEAWLRASEASFLLVSHDRAFLDATVTRCFELERGKLFSYPGNYSEAMAVKRTLREAQGRAYESHQRKVKALESEMHRLRSKGQSAGKFNPKRAQGQPKMAAKNKAEAVSRTLARQAKAIAARLERSEAPERPRVAGARVKIELQGSGHGPNEVLRLEGLRLQRGEKVLLENLNLSVRRGERVALVGANGSGKSTLLETVLGRLGTHAGEVVYGHGLEVYWSGQHGEELDAFETLQDALLAAQKELRLQDIYILLANLGLPKDPLHLLSGGEGTRLSLARLSVTRAHLLVLDEPTNHLDIHAIEALEDLLVNYPGTVLFASHDRRLVARVATRRLHLGTADPAGTG